jgi:hypothetical protein
MVTSQPPSSAAATIAASSVIIEQAAGQADPASTSPISFTVRFSEPVSGFTDAGVSLSGTAGATTAVVSERALNDSTTYNVAVSGMTGNGTVIASIPANVATDAAGNPNSAATSVDNSVTFTAAPAPSPDLTIAKRHSGEFRQARRARSSRLLSRTAARRLPAAGCR